MEGISMLSLTVTCSYCWGEALFPCALGAQTGGHLANRTPWCWVSVEGEVLGVQLHVLWSVLEWPCWGPRPRSEGPRKPLHSFYIKFYRAHLWLHKGKKVCGPISLGNSTCSLPPFEYSYCALAG